MCVLPFDIFNCGFVDIFDVAAVIWYDNIRMIAWQPHVSTTFTLCHVPIAFAGLSFFADPNAVDGRRAELLDDLQF